MGQGADALLNGDDCEGCGQYLGPGPGFPRRCAACGGDDDGDEDEGDGGPWPKKRKKVAYVVFHGRTPGIYSTWPECQAQVHGVNRARFRGYFTREDAQRAWDTAHLSGKAPEPMKKKADPPAELPKARGPHNPKVAKERVRLLFASFKGSHTVTCTRNVCSYPNCLCLGK